MKWRPDVRHLQLAILAGYALVAREVFHYERSHLTTLATVATAVSLDLLVGMLRYKVLRFPLIGLIVGLGASVQIDARGTAPFVLIAALAILSKALLVYKGRHFFNPTNFGVVALFLLFPGQATGFGSLFSGFAVPTVVFLVLGLATVALAGQLLLSMSWFAGFAVLAAARSAVLDQPLGLTLGTLMNPLILLFTFHMISDPATTPRGWRLKIAFGVSVAVIDAILRVWEVPYGHFYALFAVSCLTPWVRDYEARDAAQPGVRVAAQPAVG